LLISVAESELRLRNDAEAILVDLWIIQWMKLMISHGGFVDVHLSKGWMKLMISYDFPWIFQNPEPNQDIEI